MINLIPPEAEQVVKREYIFRVGGTILFLLGAVFMLLTVALVPTYVLIGSQIDTSVQAVKVSGEDERFTKADGEVRATEGILNQFKTDKEVLPASVVINEVESLAPEGVTFKLFTLAEEQGEITQIQVQGQAATREDLASFKVKIEASEMFATAVVPISDLARDTNLPFSVTITPARLDN